MRQIIRIAVVAAAIFAIALPSLAQEGSTATMRRGGRSKRNQEQPSGVTTRMQQRLQKDPVSDSELSWMKVIYRSLDLNKVENAPLYFPEQPVDGNESLFRIIMRLLANNQLPVYEYLDGRELFTDEHRLKAKDVLDRYHIYYQEAKGSSERNPKFEIHESDVPATEVLTYYIVEKWEFDTRTNRMRSHVEAICPVLHRSDDYGMEALKYPMFWVKYDDLRPYLSTQNIFTSDYNNLPSCTYDDYFQMALYNGDIYKTRNLRNRSMRQLYPNPDDMKHAQDSIQNELDSFEKKLWVPSLEELEAKREKESKTVAAAAEDDDEQSVDDGSELKEDKPKVTTRRGKKSGKKATPAKVKRGKAKSSSVNAPKTTSAPRRSVRDRKR